MTKLTYEDASAADVKAYQALRAMGVSKYVAYIHGILPEIIPGFLTNALYLLETIVRHSSILGYVGAGGIGLLLNEKISWLEYDKVGTILLMLFLTVCVIEYFSRYLATAWQEGDQAKKVVSPVSLIISAFAAVQDVRKTTTPLLKLKDESGVALETELILIDLGRSKNRMAGSILAQVLNQSLVNQLQM